MNALATWQGNPLAISDPRGIGRMLIAKMGNMGMKQSTSAGEWLPRVRDIYIVNENGAPRLFVYEMDMMNLPRAVTKRQLREAATLDELSEALRRRVTADEDIDLIDANGYPVASLGFSLIVDLYRREVKAHDLPRVVPFDLQHVPDIPFPVPLGVTLNRNGEVAPLVYSLPALGHIVFVGYTGAGKSGLLRSMLSALQFAETPDTLKVALVDPKMVEFSLWNGSPFLIDRVATELRDATRLAQQVNRIVDERMELFTRTRTFNLDGFNEKFPDRRMPRILFAVDEMRELSAGASRRTEFDQVLIKGAARWRFAGAHLLVTTTDPRADTIDASILSNSKCKVVGPLSRSLSRSIIGTEAAAAENFPSRNAGFFMGADLPDRRGRTYFQSYLLDDEAYPKVADFICGRSGGVERGSERAGGEGAGGGERGLSPAEQHVLDLILAGQVGGLKPGEFSVGAVFEAVKGTRVGGLRLVHSFVAGLGTRWERNGWLARQPGSSNKPRIVTTRMLSELGLELPAFMAAENSGLGE